MKPYFRLFYNLRRLKAFLRELRLEPIHLVIPSLLALVAAFFEGICFVLLAPTMRGLIEGNFHFVYSLKFIGSVLNQFPDVFLNRSSAIFSFLVFLILGAAILKNMAAYFSSMLVAKQLRRFCHELRCLIFDSYVGFKKSFFDQNSAGHLQNVLIGQTEQIGSHFKSFHSAIYGFFSLAAYLGVMLFMSWKVTLFIFIAFPVLIFMFQGLVAQMRLSSERFSVAFALLGKKISNALSCIPLVKASCAEDREKKWFAHISEEVRKTQLQIDLRGLLIQPIQEIFFLVMTLLLVSFMAYLTVRQKEGNLSDYLVFFVVIRRAMANLGSITALQGSVAAVMGPLKQVMKVFEEREAHKEKSGVLPLLKFQKDIEFRHLTFRYTDRDVLSDLNFKIVKGQMVAVVGTTGSGKSTIAQLLLRFYDPAPGMIFLDGQDILHYQISALRKKIAYISQDNYFFDASIEVNLKYGCLIEPSKQEVLSALEKAQLKDFLIRLPQGLSAEIGERGIQLSGGEKQRLSLARAILRNPEILIMDEATSAMDAQTEKFVQNAIAEVAKERTTIVIAHRLATIQKADLILVLDHGRLVDQGSFSELMSRRGHFKESWDLQFFTPDKESPQKGEENG